MNERAPRSSQTLLRSSALCACLLAAACTLKTPSTDDLKVTPGDGVHLPTSDAEVRTLLRKLFPELSDDDITRFAAKLDIKTALDLKLEIDDIRRVADKLGKELDDLGTSAAASRQSALEAHNEGFPETIEPLGRAAFYETSQQTGRIELSGVFRNREPINLLASQLAVRVEGAVQSVTLACVPETPVDIVFLVDITGSMSSVIGAVRRSLGAFVTAIEKKNIHGTMSVVTFQDSVGVNVGFQEPPPTSKYERSPFFKPVAIDSASDVADLQRFISRLEANSGADRPENLAAAIDFARNNVIGVTSKGQPNLIGDGVEDPRGVTAWPKFENPKQIFVAFTDAPFHSDSRTPSNSSLLAVFKPRPIAEILKALHDTGTTVHVSDPSWVDEPSTPTGSVSEKDIDADIWAAKTGGLGEDKIAGYSLIDLDLLVVAKDTGLLDIVLDGLIGTSCSAHFALPALSATASFDLELTIDNETFREALNPIRL